MATRWKIYTTPDLGNWLAATGELCQLDDADGGGYAVTDEGGEILIAVRQPVAVRRVE